jgi:hypothetical protein
MLVQITDPVAVVVQYHPLGTRGDEHSVSNATSRLPMCVGMTPVWACGQHTSWVRGLTSTQAAPFAYV